MTLQEALGTYSNYSALDNTISRALIDRELLPDTVYTTEIGKSIPYLLAKADMFIFLSNKDSLKELEITFTNNQMSTFYKSAMIIYGQYEPTNADYKGVTISGYIGQNYNGN